MVASSRLAAFAVLSLAACGGADPGEASDQMAQPARTSGGGAKGGGKGGSTPPAVTAAVRTTDQPTPGLTPAAVTSFSVTSTYDVYAETEYANITGTHSQTTRFFAPGEVLWQEGTFRFATDTTAASGEVQAIRVGTAYQTWDSLPVAGTAIASYGLTGTWTVRVYLDGSASPIASTSFVIQ